MPPVQKKATIVAPPIAPRHATEFERFRNAIENRSTPQELATLLVGALKKDQTTEGGSPPARLGKQLRIVPREEEEGENERSPQPLSVVHTPQKKPAEELAERLCLHVVSYVQHLVELHNEKTPYDLFNDRDLKHNPPGPIVKGFLFEEEKVVELLREASTSLVAQSGDIDNVVQALRLLRNGKVPHLHDDYHADSDENHYYVGEDGEHYPAIADYCISTGYYYLPPEYKHEDYPEDYEESINIDIEVQKPAKKLLAFVEQQVAQVLLYSFEETLHRRIEEYAKVTSDRLDNHDFNFDFSDGWGRLVLINRKLLEMMQLAFYEYIRRGGNIQAAIEALERWSMEKPQWFYSYPLSIYYDLMVEPAEIAGKFAAALRTILSEDAVGQKQ